MMFYQLPCQGKPSIPSIHVAHALQVASRLIGMKIDLAERQGIQYLELAATSDFLLTVKSVAPLFTRLIHTGLNEPKTGADFEWWIGAGQLWFGMRVQAKRHYRRHTAGHLDYYGDLAHANKNGLQVDLLIADCAKRGLVPLHMFFESRTHASPSRRAMCGNGLPSDLWGVSIADAVAIQRLVRASTLSGNDVRAVLQPATCLPLCVAGSGALIDRVMNAIRSHVWAEDRPGSAFPEPKGLPPYVQRLIEQPGELVHELPRGLDAILVVSEDEIGDF